MPVVLLVDDDPQTLDVLDLHFKLDGWDTLRATDGAQALELAATERPDLIILDWMMPTLDGLEVARTVRSDERLFLIPIVMLTARELQRDELAGFRAGIDAYVTKPLDVDTLDAEVRRVTTQILPEVTS
jgi:two-component system, OmpR family, phosphate regulon response regulator PhoB